MAHYLVSKEIYFKYSKQSSRKKIHEKNKKEKKHEATIINENYFKEYTVVLLVFYSIYWGISF